MTPEPAEPVTDRPAPSPVAAVVVLAAGGGTRMKSRTSKLLHTLAGHSMLSYAVGAGAELQPSEMVVVVGHLREQVTAHLTEIAPHVRTAHQAEQRGTGHAVQVALAELGEAGLTDLAGAEIVVTYGDVPMLRGETLAELVASHRRERNAITVLTAHAPDPTGYGRVLRDADGGFAGIVEHKDADEAQRAVTEINSGIYVFDAGVLAQGLEQVRPSEATGEYYLTKVPELARDAGQRVGVVVTDDIWEVEGVNDRVQLQRMGAEMNRRLLRHWMREGVTVVDPASTWLHADVSLGTDVTLLPGTSLEGATTIGAGATIGPDTTLIDVEVGENATIVRSHGSLAIIGPGASVGPFAYLRPGTELGAEGKIGTFVETKNAKIGPRAKVPHLTYAGDTEIGEGANIGAGTIFANYDGVNKTRSSVGRYSFVGSDSVLIHPVTIADGSYVAAGSAVTDDVAPGQLGVARGRQRNIDGWVASRRAGTKTAEAAEAADAADAAPDVHPEQPQDQTGGDQA